MVARGARSGETARAVEGVAQMLRDWPCGVVHINCDLVGAGTARAWRLRDLDDDEPAAWSLCPAGVRSCHGTLGFVWFKKEQLSNHRRNSSLGTLREPSTRTPIGWRTCVPVIGPIAGGGARIDRLLVRVARHSGYVPRSR